MTAPGFTSGSGISSIRMYGMAAGLTQPNRPHFRCAARRCDDWPHDSGVPTWLKERSSSVPDRTDSLPL